MERKPSEFTHQTERRIELSNLVLTLLLIALVPIFLFMFLNNALLVVAVELFFLVGFMDMILTTDMINRGYREQNFYRIFFAHLGDTNGFRVTIILNLILRTAISFVFAKEPMIILLCAISSFFGPLWNSLHGYTFRDDIVLQVPTEVKIAASQIEIDAGNKTRLEQRKNDDEN